MKQKKAYSSLKIKSLLHLFEALSENEWIIVDVLRQIIIENLHKAFKERISFDVAFFMAEKISSLSGRQPFHVAE